MTNMLKMFKVYKAIYNENNWQVTLINSIRMQGPASASIHGTFVKNYEQKAYEDLTSTD